MQRVATPAHHGRLLGSALSRLRRIGSKTVQQEIVRVGRIRAYDMYFGTENTFSVEFLLVLLTMPGSAPMNGLDEIPCESVDERQSTAGTRWTWSGPTGESGIT